ncbi:hypothetical protein PAHAL_1G085000 [Panicum hallii]|uniref:Embryo surrounding factor 1 brassicaceae domain-containing protein n=1 Tax=Panicum hallii TaxID=206008 RepID=A0A2S3GMJ8_9POAL|nr:hypothetical protein PAHAL_1G085000 [Panicum hallii]
MMAQSSAGEMDGKGMMAPILLALVLACLVFPAKCEGGGVERSAAGGLRRQPDQEEMAVAAGSSKIHIVLCFKTACSGPSDNTCYCCQTLGGTCFWEQHECWNYCPPAGPARRRPSSPVSASRSTSPSLESGSGLHVSGRQFVI